MYLHLIVSYQFRDPNCEKTVDAFKSSIQWALEADSFTPKDVEEAQLRLFSSIDSPVSPGNRGLTYFRNGITKDISATYRSQLLSTSKQDLIDAAKKYLLPFIGKQKPSVVAVGTNQSIPGEGWTVKSIESLNS